MERRCTCTLDVNLASQVQQLLFPKSSPQCSWCCIGVKNRMADGLGGDYYDFLESPDGCQVVFLGDVTGHGLSASVVMSLIYGFIHHSSASGCSPIETVREVNAFLLRFARRSRRYDHHFSTTFFYGVIDPDSGAMDYINAGHVPPLVRRGESVRVLKATAQPLGFFDDLEVQAGRFVFQRGDRMLLYTDGLSETSGVGGELFGAGRLQSQLLSHGGDHLEFLETLFGALAEFSQARKSQDDCTAIVLDYHGPFPQESA